MNKKIRIQKVLANNGLMSRREAESAILTGQIKVNGHPAQIGMKIDPFNDVVHIKSKKINLNINNEKIYIMLYKPRGYITTTKDELDRKCVMDLLPDITKRVYPIGRLDKISEGMLLLTNDGDFANFMMHPKSNIPKTYRVTVKSHITDEQVDKLTCGVTIDSGLTLPCNINIISNEKDHSVFNITITEGKNRQIRKMCETVNLNVIRLKRTSIGNLKLGMLKPGQYRYLSYEEIKAIKRNFKK